MLDGIAPLPHGSCVRCASAYAFLRIAEPLGALPETDKRSRLNGLAVLDNYFDHYANDAYTVLSDDLGPICERKFEMTLSEDATSRIVFFGTIDSVLIDEVTTTILVCDHKTTSVLGTDFYNRLRPNFQYVGYVLAAQKVLGLETNLFMSNGIQVAKTVKGLARQVVTITDEDFVEFRQSIEWYVAAYHEARTRGIWPMSAPNPCVMWGSCTYRAVCEVPAALRESVIKSLYDNENENENEPKGIAV
jgi:hypothetical protein